MRGGSKTPANSARNDDGSRQWGDKPCCGLVETLEQRRELRFSSNKPRPWIERKFMVGVVFAIVGYTWYVYVGRLCVPMMKRNNGALGNRAMGSTCPLVVMSRPITHLRDSRKSLLVAFLVVFCFLGLMFLWSYIKVWGACDLCACGLC